MENDGRESIEWRLRRILKNYEQARSVGDFKDTVLGVHTALEDAMNLDLDPAARDWPFGQKFLQLFPDLHERYQVDELNRQRNHYAHPKRVFEPEETRQTAQRFVELTILVWPRLFRTRVPVITFPVVATARDVSQENPAKRSSGAASEKPSAFPRRWLSAWRNRTGASSRQFAPFFRLPWFSLLFGIVLLAGVAFLAGLVEYSLRNRLPGAWYWIALPGALLLAAVFFAARGFWRFLTRLGFRRLGVGLAGGLAVAILVVALFMPPPSPDWSGRLSGAAMRVMDSTRQAGIEAAIFPFAWGKKIASQFLTPLVFRLAALGPKANMEAFSPFEATPTTGLAPTSGGTKIALGAKVKVMTDGSRLRGRESPGLNTPVTVYFPFGEQLTIVDGPREADGYIWWRVEGKEGSGWSAENFLALIP